MTATERQCAHWRAIRPRRLAVQQLTDQWIAECGVPPTQVDLAAILGLAPATVAAILHPRYQRKAVRQRPRYYRTYLKAVPHVVNTRRVDQARVLLG